MSSVTPTVTPSRTSRKPHGLAQPRLTAGVTRGHDILQLTAPLSKWGAREGCGSKRERLPRLSGENFLRGAPPRHPCSDFSLPYERGLKAIPSETQR